MDERNNENNRTDQKRRRQKNAKRTVIVMLNVMAIVPVESNAQIRKFRIKFGNQWSKR